MSKTPTVKQAALDSAVESLRFGVDGNESPSKLQMGRSRIMYIECKTGALTGEAVIGRVYFSKTGKTLHYKNQSFQSLKGAGFKSNYYDVETGADYWISGPKKDGSDRLYGENVPVVVDEDVAEEYWTEIRGLDQPPKTT